MDFSGSPARVYERVVELSDEEFAELMADQESRDGIIDTLVTHMSSLYVGDDDVDAVIHVKLWDRPGGGYDHRELVLENGTCTVSDVPHLEPRLTLKVRPEDLRRIVNGDAGSRRLALQRRLTVLGDLRFGMRLSKLFDL